MQQEHPVPPAPRASNVPYIVAVVFMSLLGVVAVLGITLMRPNADNAGLITTVLGFLLPTTMALLAYMKSQETHLSVNSRMDEFKVQISNVAYNKGVADATASAVAAAIAAAQASAGKLSAATNELAYEKGISVTRVPAAESASPHAADPAPVPVVVVNNAAIPVPVTPVDSK